MPQRIVEIPGVGNVEFPDSMSDAEVSTQAARLYRESQQAKPPTPQPATTPAPRVSNLDRLAEMVRPMAPAPFDSKVGSDVAVGAMKGAERSLISLGELFHKIPGFSEGVDSLYGTPGLSKEAFKQANESTAYTGPAQTAGGAMEAIGELALPGAKGANAVPSAARASQKFERVMSVAKDIPIDTSAPGDVALRIQQLAERGGSMPMAVRKLLNRMTDPNLPEMTYKEARDFASNISRLSADEFQRLTPVVKRAVGDLRVALNKSIADAAGKAGKTEEYLSAMSEYANAAKLREGLSTVRNGIQKGLPMASGAGAAYWLTQKLKDALGDR